MRRVRGALLRVAWPLLVIKRADVVAEAEYHKAKARGSW